jgi:hypothetical protein
MAVCLKPRWYNAVFVNISLFISVNEADAMSLMNMIAFAHAEFSCLLMTHLVDQ